MTAKQRREAKRTGNIKPLIRNPKSFRAKALKTSEHEAEFKRRETAAGRQVTSQPARRGTQEDIRRGQTPPEQVSHAIQQAKSAKSIKSQTTPTQAQPIVTPEGDVGVQEAFTLEQPILDEQGQPILKSMEEQEEIDNLKLNMDPEFAVERAGARPNPTALEVGAVVAATGVTAAVAVAAAKALLIAAGTGLAGKAAQSAVGQAPQAVWRTFPSGEPALAGAFKRVGFNTLQRTLRVAPNPITFERTRVFIGKLLPKGFKNKILTYLVLASLGSWSIGLWGRNEGIDGLTHARENALDEGNTSLSKEIKKDLNIALDEAMWETIASATPVLAIPISAKRINLKIKGNKALNKVMDEKEARLEAGGLTPEEQRFEDIRIKKATAEENLAKRIEARDIEQAEIRKETAESIAESQTIQRARDRIFAEQRGEELPPTPEETARLHEELFVRKKKK